MPTPQAIRQLVREITQLRAEPPEGIRVCARDEDMLDLTGIIEGPEGTPYEGGYFRVKFNFTDEYPGAPPKCHFVTKLFHPNVSSSGEICVNTLKKDWRPSFGISHILTTIKCLLIYPNPESALDEEAGRLLLEDYAEFEKRARLICEVHAKPKVKPPEFDAPAVPSQSTSESSAVVAKLPPSALSRRSPSPLLPTSAKSQTNPVVRKSVTPPPPVAPPVTPLQPTVNSSSCPLSAILAPSSVLQTSGNVSQAVLPSTTTNVKTRGKRESTTVAGGAEKRKKALKRL